MEPIEVKHDEPNHRFVVTLPGEEAHLLYRRSGSCMDFYRTYVPESFRGRGIAEKLCKTAFEYAKANHFTVIPTCSYISGAYLKRHPEYRPLIQSGEVA